MHSDPVAGPGHPEGGRLNIVCVDDESDDVELVRLALERGGVDARVVHVQDEAALAAQLATPPDLVLCDYSMPAFSAERALQVLQRAPQPVPLVVVSRAIGEDAVVALFRAGAKDYVGKDKLALLPAVIRRVLAAEAAERERARTARALALANERLRLLSARLVDAQERERTAVARELHDSLGQGLTGIVIHLHAAARSAEPAQAQRCLERALELAQQAIRQVKSISFQLRPSLLQQQGFVAAVRATLERQLESSGVQGTLRLRGSEPQGVVPAHAAALRVLQEALTNVLRHAQAHQVVVRLHFTGGDRFTLTVGDDGRGFDPAAALAPGLSERNMGLFGMLERAELLGGRLRLRSCAGRGTLVRLSL